MYEKDINSAGIENLGKGLGTQIKIHTKKENPRIIVGHDYRSYSEEIKVALKKGLINLQRHIENGCKIDSFKKSKHTLFLKKRTKNTYYSYYKL